MPRRPFIILNSMHITPLLVKQMSKEDLVNLLKEILVACISHGDDYVTGQFLHHNEGEIISAQV